MFNTVGNTDKKAGALNQALAELFREISARDVVMVMDADSVIVPEFLETAMGRLEADPDLMAVGGVFYGEDGAGLVGQLQRNEYTRYQRVIARRLGQVFVLTGTASLFRTYALKAVADSRGQLLPGDPGRVYDTLALTEDNEMTLALKTLGAKMVSPRQCRVTTELMPNWRALWRQRMRWQRGALENIGAYGLTRATLRYWLQQIGIGYGTVALNAYLLLMTITLLAADSFELVWFWVGDRLDFRRRTGRHGLGRRLARHGCSPSPWSSRSPTTSSCRPSTSNRCSTSRPAAPPAGTTSPAKRRPPDRRSSNDHVRRHPASRRRAQIGLVPGARHFRRDQHAHLCRTQPRQAHPTSTRVMRRLFLIFVITIACIDGVVLRAPGATGASGPCGLRLPPPQRGELPFRVPAGGRALRRTLAGRLALVHAVSPGRQPVRRPAHRCGAARSRSGVLSAFRGALERRRQLLRRDPAARADVKCDSSAQASIGNDYWRKTRKWWIGATPPGITRDEVVKAVRNAQSEWTNNINWCGIKDQANPPASYQGNTSGDAIKHDGKNIVDWGSLENDQNCNMSLACTFTCVRRPGQPGRLGHPVQHRLQVVDDGRVGRVRHPVRRGARDRSRPPVRPRHELVEGRRHRLMWPYLDCR